MIKPMKKHNPNTESAAIASYLFMVGLVASFLLFAVGSITITRSAVNATNPYACSVPDVNTNQYNSGSIADTGANYTNLQTQLAASYNSNAPSTNIWLTTNTAPATLIAAYPYYKAGYAGGSWLGITPVVLNQALQGWMGIAGTQPTENYPYVNTFTPPSALVGMKMVFGAGDSLMTGYGAVTNKYPAVAVPEQGPFGNDQLSQLCEGYANWSKVLRINQAHSATGVPALQNALTNDFWPYRPQNGEARYVVFTAGDYTDCNTGSLSGPTMITNSTGYVTTLHALGFKVICVNLTATGSLTGTKQTALLYFNANMTNIGGDYNVDIYTPTSTNVALYIGANPHMNPLGYGLEAALINAAVPNP